MVLRTSFPSHSWSRFAGLTSHISFESNALPCKGLVWIKQAIAVWNIIDNAGADLLSVFLELLLHNKPHWASEETLLQEYNYDVR